MAKRFLKWGKQSSKLTNPDEDTIMETDLTGDSKKESVLLSNQQLQQPTPPSTPSPSHLDITSSLNDQAYDILIRLPYELIFRVWNYVILNNFTTAQVCDMIGWSDVIDSNVSLLLSSCVAEVNALRGFKLSCSSRGLGFIPDEYTIRFSKLVEFMLARNIKFKKTIVVNAVLDDIPITEVDGLEQMLISSTNDLQIGEIGLPKDLRAHMGYLSKASSLRIRYSYDHFDPILHRFENLKHLTIHLIGTISDTTCNFNGLKNWVKKSGRKLTIVLVLENTLPNEFITLLHSLACANIKLQLDLDFADASTIHKLNSLMNHITKFTFQFHRIDKQFTWQWVDDLTNVEDLSLQWDTDYLLNLPTTIVLNHKSLRSLKLYYIPENVFVSITQLHNLKELIILDWSIPSFFFNQLPPTLKSLIMTCWDINAPSIALPTHLVNLTLHSVSGTSNLPSINNSAQLKFLSSVNAHVQMNHNSSTNFQIVQKIQSFIDSLPKTVYSMGLLMFPPANPSRDYEPYLDLLNFTNLELLRELKFTSLIKEIECFNLFNIPPLIETLDLDVNVNHFSNLFPVNLTSLNLNLCYYSSTIDEFWENYIAGNCFRLKSFQAKQGIPNVGTSNLIDFSNLNFQNLQSFNLNFTNTKHNLKDRITNIKLDLNNTPKTLTLFKLVDNTFHEINHHTYVRCSSSCLSDFQKIQISPKRKFTWCDENGNVLSKSVAGPKLSGPVGAFLF